MKAYPFIFFISLSISCVSYNSKKISQFQSKGRSIAEDLVTCVSRNKEKLNSISKTNSEHYSVEEVAEKICEAGEESDEFYKCMETYSNLKVSAENYVWRVSYLRELCHDEQTFKNAADAVKCTQTLGSIEKKLKEKSTENVRRWKYVPFITKDVQREITVTTPFFDEGYMSDFQLMRTSCIEAGKPLLFAKKAKKCAEKINEDQLHGLFGNMYCLGSANIDVLECVNSYRDQDVSSRIIKKTCLKKMK